MLLLAPSILAADFKNLGNDIKAMDQAGAHYVHIDVMDGDYVPSISFGMPVIKSIRSATDKIFDVHLMIKQPERYIDEFANCGADIITVHAEACTHLDRTISMIKEKGLKAGISLNPATSLECLEYVLDKVDMVLIMSVNPGFGGQQYIPFATRKIQELRKMVEERKLNLDIEVDGGINLQNVRTIIEAGANVIVAGSSIFNGDITKNTKNFLEIFEEYKY